MRAPLRLFVLVAGLLLGAVDLQAQLRYLCFGDSITLGNYDEAEIGGYPGRLLGASRLNCAVNGCEVINKGKSGEKTPGGLTRIDTVVNNNPSDILLLMEGTNDIFVEYSHPDHGTWSYETMVFNLKEMARKAEDRGIDAVHASIIHFHPNGDHGTSKDGEVEDLRNAMESSATTNSRYFVDNWAVLCPTLNCFNNHYAPSPPDDRGHPDASGYAIMADQFYDEIVKQPPPGVPSPQSPSGTTADLTPTFTWNREGSANATWYRFQLESTAGTLLDTWLKASEVCTAGSCSYDPGLNLSNGGYSFRLRARNPAGLSAWSSDRNFTVSADVIFLDGFESGNTAAWPSSLP